jgi:carbonic anhydrase
MNELREGYRRFASADDGGLYRRLASGQAPHTLVLSCSDSRIVPEVLFDAEPGELFVLRTVGNLARTDDPCVAAAIDYAIDQLKVRRVAVLAHGDCGAVKASRYPERLGENLGRWLSGETYEGESVEEAVRNAGIRQMRRLEAHPSVREALAAGTLSLELYHFRLETRELFLHEEGQWRPI